jgi:membrane protein required for colicin V production
MTEIDYAILAVLGFSAIAGALRGFLREALGFATWIIALWMAWKHSDVVSPYLGGALAAEPLRLWAARGLMLFAVLAAGTLVAVLVSQMVRVSLFSGFDRFLGFAFGVLRAFVILGLLAMLAGRLQLDREPWWKASTLVPYVEWAGQLVSGLVGDAKRQVGAAVTAASGPSPALGP